ncbi:Maf family nucleotide pyrophosphatase [Sphingobacterium sp. LRF_L2]|uniref:Maf family nucleotide pyrophosphatase n=1 Tax=Sphingobacterium sp. LRF_L2 TaxID=3369421 RepID=UPI003F5D8C85
MMLIDRLKDVRVVLGSQSPRRKELLAKLEIDFQVIVKETDEQFDKQLSPSEIVRSIALNKLYVFEKSEFQDALVITADTVVVHEGRILGKPKDRSEAIETLRSLQGQEHLVLTAVAISYEDCVYDFVEETIVKFFELSEEEICHYVDQYMPLDKAGSYGIQEWIGLMGIKAIHGSYENVVGLPVARLYQKLKEIF